jgi:hypothetical protein
MPEKVGCTLPTTFSGILLILISQKDFFVTLCVKTQRNGIA